MLKYVHTKRKMMYYLRTSNAEASYFSSYYFVIFGKTVFMTNRGFITNRSKLYVLFSCLFKAVVISAYLTIVYTFNQG